MRALAVVKCQSALAWFAFRSCGQHVLHRGDERAVGLRRDDPLRKAAQVAADCAAASKVRLMKAWAGGRRAPWLRIVPGGIVRAHDAPRGRRGPGGR
jgi:hypothetical protein